MEQLLIVYEEVAAGIDRGEFIDVVLFDYSKAFGIVSHQVLLTKLQSIGIDSQILSWVETFLTGRTMQVCVKREFSSHRTVLGSVLQISTHLTMALINF